jgi:hypothetical protein
VNQPSLKELVASHRARNIVAVVGPLLAIGAIWAMLDSEVDANSTDIRRLEQTALTVARVDTEIEYIKAGIARVEKSGDERHKEVLQTLTGIEQELRFMRAKGSPGVPPSMKGMLQEPLSER